MTYDIPEPGTIEVVFPVGPDLRIETTLHPNDPDTKIGYSPIVLHARNARGSEAWVCWDVMTLKNWNGGASRMLHWDGDGWRVHDWAA